MLDLPLRVPLPSKITIRVLPRIDLADRVSDVEEGYELVTGVMQDALSGLAATAGCPSWAEHAASRVRAHVLRPRLRAADRADRRAPPCPTRI